jgi:hypothetical protein
MRRDWSWRSRARWPCEMSQSSFQSSLWHGRPPFAKAHDHGVGRSLDDREILSLFFVSVKGFRQEFTLRSIAVRFLCRPLAYNRHFRTFRRSCRRSAVTIRLCIYRSKVMSHVCEVRALFGQLFKQRRDRLTVSRRGGAGRGRPPQAAARKAGLEVVEKVLTAGSCPGGVKRRRGGRGKHPNQSALSVFYGLDQ